jgi:hypothetical protein
VNEVSQYPKLSFSTLNTKVTTLYTQRAGQKAKHPTGRGSSHSSPSQEAESP